MNIKLLLYIPVLCSLIACTKNPVDYVNPFIGTENSIRPSIWEANGGTYPGAVLPFGMVQVTPEDYHYNTRYIRSFSLLEHTMGYPKGSAGIFQIMPFTGEPESMKKTGSVFRHEKERASPGYYSVFLDDYGVNAAMTATERCAFMKFSFEESQGQGIVIHQLTELRQEEQGKLQGKCRNYHFFMELDDKDAEIKIENDTVLIRFNDNRAKEVLVKIGFSFSNVENAAVNLKAEIPDWDFDRVKLLAENTWNKLLSKVMVEGGSEDEKIQFYTALYHTYLAPRIISDYGQAKRYAGLSPWDTYKTKHPLLTLLSPEIQTDMVQSVLEQFQRDGLMDPGPMTGVHNVQVLLDSYVKGIDINPDTVYEAMKASLMLPPYGRRDIASFYEGDYVPAEKSYAVTKTLEYTCNFWAMAQMAIALGKKDDYNLLIEKSSWFKNIYNPNTKFMTAKTGNGKWEKGGYREGDKWSYNWTPVHDVQALINLAGGKEEFVRQLDTCFLSRKYFHDNEPQLHNAWLYSYAGKPWKTEETVRRIMEQDYSNQPGGLSGNDDLGALSAWYVFSSMGIFPACPGRPEYVLGSPVFEQVTIFREEGQSLIIKAKNASKKNRYVQSVRLNGKTPDNLWINHRDLIEGGILEFEMGDLPHIREVEAKHLPKSETDNIPAFSIRKWNISKTRVGADEPFEITLTIENTEDCAGSFPVQVYVNGEQKKTKWFLVEGGETFAGSINMKWYEPGILKLAINNEEPKELEVIADREARFEFGDLVLPSPPVVQLNSPVSFISKVKNTGSYTGTEEVELQLAGMKEDTRRIELMPGEEKEVVFTRSFPKAGHYTIKIGNTETRKLLVVGPGFSEEAVYDKNMKPLMAFSFNKPGVKTVRDFSLLKNNAIVHGEVEWVDGLFGKAIKTNAYKEAYVEIPDHPDYNTIANGKIMTIMLWIYPVDEKNFADIISKGDLNVIQVRASNTEVNYYSGGYQRGEAYTLLPDDWNRKWHHLAGVSDGKSLTLYIDGKRMVTKLLEEGINFTGTTHHPWNIGRNAANPDRVFDGYIDQLMIFDKALTEEEINEFMLFEKDE